jgi:nitroreductase
MNKTSGGRMDSNTLDELIRSRRSIRKWKKERISDDLITKAIELGTWAPNGGNFQGWHFVIVKNAAVIKEMADVVQETTDKIASWPEAAACLEDMTRYQQNASFWRNTPAMIGAFTKKYHSPIDKVLTVRESFDDDAKRILTFRKSAPTAIQSVAAAVTTMLLALHHMGLGAVWLAGPLIAKKEIETILKVPPELELVCLVAVGYPDESPKKNRRPVKEVIKFVP